MFKSLFKNRVKILIEGVNIKRLIKTLVKNKIEIYDLNFISYKQIEITIKANKQKQIKSFLKNYRYKTIKNYGFSLLKKFSLSNLGIIIGLFIFFACVFLNTNFVSKIYISGNDKIQSSEIINYLKTKNIKTNTFLTILNTEKLEKDLENNFKDISLCSIIRKGTNIIINIKEKLYASEILESKDLVSKFNGQILKIDCKQGTPLVKVGDSVQIGDILIAGFLENNSTKVNCIAIGEIQMKVWYTNTFKFFNETTNKVRTGKLVTNSYFKFFNKNITIKKPKINFEKYEKETKESYLFENNIVPIKIFKEYFYEIKENVVKNEFSSEKDAIIDKTLTEALSLVPQNVEVINSFTEISDTENGKIITSYVETIQSFT